MNLKRISDIIVLSIFVINIFLIGFFRGSDLAMLAPKWMQGSSVSKELMLSYIYINTLIVIFFIGKIAKRKILSGVICFLALFLTYFPYRHIYLQKSIFYNDGLPINHIFTESVPVDLISLSLIIVLLGFQAFTAFKHYFDWKHRNAKIK